MKRLLLFLAALPAFAQFPVIPTPYQLIDGRSGTAIPCAGCSIYTYAATTNTPLATYTDASLGTTNTNPVLTNSAGYAVNVSNAITGIWIGASCYKFVAKDASAVILWTQDNICSPGTNASFIITGVLPPAQGGTGIANTATLTLGSSNQNWATLGSGLVCNTTSTGALSVCTGQQITGSFTGCTARVTFTGSTQATAVVLVSDTTGLQAGMYVNGTGITAGTQILSVSTNTSITLNLAASNSASESIIATTSQTLGGNGLCNTQQQFNTPAMLSIGLNMNSTADQAIAIRYPFGKTRFAIRKITMSNASISLTTAVGGIYTGTGKSGTQIVASTQIYSALTSSALFLDMTLNTPDATNAYQQTVFYFSLTTPQGSAATADLSMYVDFLP